MVSADAEVFKTPEPIGELDTYLADAVCVELGNLEHVLTKSITPALFSLLNFSDIPMAYLVGSNLARRTKY